MLAQLGLTAVVGGLWRFPNPSANIGRRLGIEGGRTLLTDFGGQVLMQLFDEIADRIHRGEVDVAVILGGECHATRRALARSGQASSKAGEPEAQTDEFWGKPLSWETTPRWRVEPTSRATPMPALRI